VIRGDIIEAHQTRGSPQRIERCLLEGDTGDEERSGGQEGEGVCEEKIDRKRK